MDRSQVRRELRNMILMLTDPYSSVQLDKDDIIKYLVLLARALLLLLGEREA